MFKLRMQYALALLNYLQFLQRLCPISHLGAFAHTLCPEDLVI